MGNAVAGAARKAVLSAEFVFDLFRLGALAVTKPIDPLLSDEHIAAVGALVVAMSRIDSLLTDLLALMRRLRMSAHSLRDDWPASVRAACDCIGNCVLGLHARAYYSTARLNKMRR
jgi:hypothetical protein